MRSLSTFAFSLLAGATPLVFAGGETPTLPPLPDGKVLCVVIPRNARLDKSQVDFQFADGQTITVAQGKALAAEWRLKKTEWSGDGKQAIITFRQGNEQRELRVPGKLVAQNGAQRAPRPSLEVQYQFYELPIPALGRVQQALDATPGEDRLLTEMLKRALDGGAPPQMLAPLQFEALSQFLAGSRDVDSAGTSRMSMKSGQRGVFEEIREFRYPTSWENEPDPEPPANAFETRNCGVTVEVEATVVHGPLIALEMMPQVVELLGAEDLDDAKAYPYKSRAEHLPERARNLLDKVPFTVPRPARYVFSARAERALLEVPPGYGVLLTGLSETEKTAPFEKAAPHGQLIVLVKVDLVAN